MLFSYSFICVAANIKMRDELSLYDAYVHNKCDFRNWEFYSKISPDDANQSIHRVHAKIKIPQRTVIPLHYQVDDLDDLTGV